MRLEAIHIYPVKACAGLSLDRCMVEPSGLRFDRRWMVVESDGRFLTRRREPALAGMQARDEGDGWLLEFGGAAGCRLPKSPDGGRSRTVEIWGDRVRAVEGSPAASRWLADQLKRDVALVFVQTADLRSVDGDYGRPGDVVSFADGYPVLLVNEASVRGVSDVAGRTLQVRRFRPNLVFSGAEAFAEDGWARVRIGEVKFDVVKPCARCRVVDQDPDTGAPDEGVLRALGTFRRSAGKVLFGENLVPRSGGEVRVGDSLVVEKRRVSESVIMDT